MHPALFQVTLTARARRDLRGIYEYIAVDSPRNASKVIVELLDAADSLATFPHRFDVPRNQANTSRNIRSMPVRPYLIRYRINDNRKSVEVLHIRHGARRD